MLSITLPQIQPFEKKKNNKNIKITISIASGFESFS